MRPALLSVVILVVLGHAARANGQQPDLSTATSEFGQRLHQKIAREQKNVVFSPVGTHSILTLTYLGARNETAWEMNKTLSLDNFSGFNVHNAYQGFLAELKSIQDVKVKVVGRIYVNENTSIEISYEKEVEKEYSTSVELITWPGYEKVINAWVSDQTDGLVKQILSRGTLDAGTAMILVNSLYINGTWQDGFDKNKTQKHEFTRPDGSKLEVEMMNSNRSILFKRDEENRLDIVELPLKGGQLNFFFVLPREIQGISRLEDLIKDSSKLNKLFENLRPTYCNVCIPKFGIDSRFDLESTLKEMGMVKATSRGEADFSGISKNGGLHISKVVHETVIEVDEDGTLAAAGTAPVAPLPRVSSEEASESFIANRAFMFFVKHKPSNQILLQGKYSGDTR